MRKPGIEPPNTYGFLAIFPLFLAFTFILEFTVQFLMRKPGIEPGQIAWEAIVIPLDHSRVKLIRQKYLKTIAFIKKA